MRTIRRVFLHCSDSTYGDAAIIDGWHAQRGFASPSGKHIGYHWCVLGGRRGPGKIDHDTGRMTFPYLAADDGVVEPGRPESEVGAHVEGENYDSIGVCLIGKDGLFTVAQLRATVMLVRDILKRYELSWSAVFAHYQAPSALVQGKTCPDFSIDHFRALLRPD